MSFYMYNKQELVYAAQAEQHVFQNILQKKVIE